MKQKKLIKYIATVLILLSLANVAYATAITASDAIKYSDDGLAYNEAGSYTLLKQITVTDSYTGSWRITYEMSCVELDVDGCSSQGAYSKIYKNGVAWGTEHSSFTDAQFNSYSQDFSSLSILSGDNIQIYGYGSPGLSEVDVQNFRIKFDLPPSSSFIPPAPANMAAATGNFYVNTTWTAGSGNVTNSYNISFNNGSWLNTTNAYVQNTLSAHGWQNVSVWAFNNSVGNLSLTSTSLNTQIPNNYITISNTVASYALTEGQTLSIDTDYADTDGDTGTFYTNATKGSINSGTGVFTWNTVESDQGNYNFNISVYDGYGSRAIANFTVVVGNSTPGTPSSLTPSTSNFFVNYTWIAGDNTDTFNVSYNGTWYNTSSATSINKQVPPHGWGNITVQAWNSTLDAISAMVTSNNRVPNNVPVQSIIGNQTVNENTWLNFTITTTDADTDAITYGTNASKGSLVSNSFSWKPYYSDAGTYTWYFNSDDGYGGVDNETITVTVNDMDFIPPVPVINSTMTGNFWINTTWTAGAGNVTDGFNISFNNGTWYNTSINYTYNSLSAHSWQNVTVWAWNSSVGNLSSTSMNNNTRVPNNPITVGNVSATYSLTEGQTLNVSANYSDLDSDTGTFATNATKGTFNTTTGILNWVTASGDAGTYNWQINITDGYGSVNMSNFTVTVTAAAASSTTSTSTASSTSSTGGGATFVDSSGNVLTSQDFKQYTARVMLKGDNARIEMPGNAKTGEVPPVTALNLYFQSTYSGEYTIQLATYTTYSPALNKAKLYFSLAPGFNLKSGSTIEIPSTSPIEVYQLYGKDWKNLKTTADKGIYKVSITSFGIFAIKDSMGSVSNVVQAKQSAGPINIVDYEKIQNKLNNLSTVDYIIVAAIILILFLFFGGGKDKKPVKSPTY